MSVDIKLRNYLLTTVIGVLITIGSCYGKAVSADVEMLKKENTRRQVENATQSQDIKDFRASFEEFKREVNIDIVRRRSGNR